MSGKRKDSKGRNLPEGFSERADGVYMSRFTFEGKRYSFYGKDLEELKKKTVQAKANLQNGSYLKIDNTTLNNFFMQYMETYKKPRLREVTYCHDLQMWRLYVKDSSIGNIKIKDLKRIQIVRFLNSLYDEKNLSWSTVKIVKDLLGGCLTEAVNNGIITRNPVDKITKELSRNDRKPKERAALTEEQQEQFISYIKNSSVYNVHLPIFTFFLATGCRSGEVTGITWNDIDLAKKEICIDHTLNYKKLDGEKMKFFITPPKTESGKRTIPIINELKVQLIKQKEYNFSMGIPNTYEVDGYSNFVFMTRTGKPYTNAHINRVIREIVKENNIAETERAKIEHREPRLLPTFSPHQLRHTFCTRLCESTTDIKSIQSIMGHSDVQTTLGIYAHATEKKKVESMAALEEKIKIV